MTDIATYTLKRGDTAPVIQDTLLDANGNAVNLTGSTIRFHMANWERTTVIVNGVVTGWGGAALGSSGQVEYAPMSADVATAGVFKAEWEVTFSGGKIETWPDEGHAVVNIEVDLA